MNRCSTITGRTFDLSQLSPSERSLLVRLEDEFRKEPAWDEFSDFWQDVLKETLSRIPRDSRTSHPLYSIAQDLEMRLGIAQGAVAAPDDRD